MSLLRTSTNSIRRVAAPSAVRPAMMAVRGYADEPKGEFSEQYQRGNPQGFSRREQASENEFVRQQEADKLKALREKLQQQRKHLDDVESAIDDLHKSDKK